MKTVRVLATPETVERLFERTTTPYSYLDNGGGAHQCDLTAWRCRRCGWVSLLGARGLPFPHEHDEGIQGVALGLTSFEG